MMKIWKLKIQRTILLNVVSWGKQPLEMIVKIFLVIKDIKITTAKIENKNKKTKSLVNKKKIDTNITYLHSFAYIVWLTKEHIFEEEARNNKGFVSLIDWLHIVSVNNIIEWLVPINYLQRIIIH